MGYTNYRHHKLVFFLDIGGERVELIQNAFSTILNIDKHIKHWMFNLFLCANTARTRFSIKPQNLEERPQGQTTNSNMSNVS